MLYLVYKTTNLVNGKHYIGAHRTESLNDDYIGSGKLLKRAIQKYGIENFQREILFEAESVQAMYAKEAELVVLGPESYNLRLGGMGGWDHLNTPEGIKNRAWTFDNWHKAGTKRLLEKIKTDKKFAEKIRCNALSAAKIALSRGPTFGFRGKQHSIETKAKIGLANSKHQQGEGNSNFGKPRSEETKAKMSAAIKGRHFIINSITGKRSLSERKVK